MAALEVIGAAESPASAFLNIADGVSVNFIASDLSNNETIVIEGLNSSGDYSPITYIDAGGNKRQAGMERDKNTVTVNGPADIRIVKPRTILAVEVSRYT